MCDVLCNVLCGVLCVVCVVVVCCSVLLCIGYIVWSANRCVACSSASTVMWCVLCCDALGRDVLCCVVLGCNQLFVLCCVMLWYVARCVLLRCDALCDVRCGMSAACYVMLRCGK